MGFFNKAEKESQQKLEKSIAGFRKKVISNFDSATANDVTYTSTQIADKAEELLYVSIDEDDEDLRWFALHVTLEINKSTNQEKSIKERGEIAFVTSLKSTQLRNKYANHPNKKINENLVIIGLSLHNLLESAEDWDQVLQAVVGISQEIQNARKK